MTATYYRLVSYEEKEVKKTTPIEQIAIAS